LHTKPTSWRERSAASSLQLMMRTILLPLTVAMLIAAG